MTESFKVTAATSAAVIALHNAVTSEHAASAYKATRLYALLLAKPKGIGSDSAYARWLVESAQAGEFKHDAGKADPNVTLAQYTPGSLRASMLRARKDATAQGFENDPTEWAKAIEAGRAQATAGRSVKPVDGPVNGGKGKRVTRKGNGEQAPAVDTLPAAIDALIGEGDKIAADPSKVTKTERAQVAQAVRSAVLLALQAGMSQDEIGGLIADAVAASATLKVAS